MNQKFLIAIYWPLRSNKKLRFFNIQPECTIVIEYHEFLKTWNPSFYSHYSLIKYE